MGKGGTQRSHWVLLLIWTANGLGLVLLAGALLYFWGLRQPTVLAAPATPQPTQTAFVESATRGPYYLPSVTPRATFSPYPTPSPLPPLASLAVGHGPFVIGHSVEGRPLEVYRFGDGPTVRMIVAGIHGGNEWNTIALADQLIAYLYVHPELVPENISLYILRNLNPDGEARIHGVDGRVNAHGVDLNRNWPYRWKAEWGLDGCWQYRPVTAGNAPASEPETRALMTYMMLYKPVALISYHSAALGVFAGGLPTLPDSERLAKTLASAGGYQYPPIDTGCDYTGNLADWASSVQGIAAVDIELTNHTDTDFDQNLRVLKAFLNWKR
jgi:protein MpaA